MQFSIVALVAATGALAAPNRGDRGDRISGNRNTQSISCTGGSAYCCSPEYTDGGYFSNYKCDKNINSCNVANTIVCCNNNAQGIDSVQVQTCSAFGNQKVIFV
ncbi:hypothetical protein FMUND_15804 [Fusarium mundagurra]|uniref:Hydrophobin n=1 Tax=Fusarium mundagurra TaxID=1567541 RepID=A0A8H5XLP8_9HYPO|nr:hypothetical protein FMUND_15804 [Fusarium mundagurra]